MARESMEWLDAIASRAKVDTNRVESVLAARHIYISCPHQSCLLRAG